MARQELGQAGRARGTAPPDPDIVAREMADGNHRPTGRPEARRPKDFARALGRIAHRYCAPAELRASRDAPDQEVRDRPAVLA